ncbi:MAG: MFS transporter [Candidatus Hodarchaeales archaeon]|jgi:MFS family permease
MVSIIAHAPVSYNRATWTAGLATLFANLPLLIYGLYVNIFLREDLVTIILIITIIGTLRNLLQIFLRIPLGELSQIIGRKPLIVMGHFAYTLALFLMSIATDWTLVFLSTAFIGIGMSCYWPAIFGYVGDVDIDRIGESQGRIFRQSDIGSIIGTIFVFYLLDSLEFSLPELFGTIAIISFITGIITILLLPESLTKENRKIVDNVPKALLASWSTMIKSMRTMSITNQLWNVYFFHFILAFIEFTTSYFVPVIIVSKGFADADVSSIWFWSLILIFWIKPYLGRLTDEFEFISVITVSMMVTCVGVLAYVFTDDYYLLIGLYIIVNSSIIVSYFAANGETARRAPIESRGMALGVFGVYVSLGRTTSTVFLGPIWEFFNLATVFVFSSVLIFSTIFLLRRVINQSQKKKESTTDKNLSKTWG